LLLGWFLFLPTVEVGAFVGDEESVAWHA
jgi:hypothetical protein